MNICSSDFGAFAIGRKILLESPKAGISFFVAGAKTKDDFLEESSFWQSLIDHAVSQSKFGRIGIIYDRKNKTAHSFCKQLAKTRNPQFLTEKRGNKYVQFNLFEPSLLADMANEGVADSVEFRRLARRVFKNAKHLHLDSIIFIEAIFSEKETTNVLQHLAGSQIKVKTISDISIESISSKSSQKITIFTKDNAIFTHKRAQELLHQKLSFSCVKEQ